MYAGITPYDCLVVVPEEGIFLALNAILAPGDHAICTFPGYQSLYEVAKGIGCEVTRWLPEEENGWRFDPDFLEGSIRPNTKLLIVNFPHNPTGYLPSREDYKRIVALARRHNLYLLSDEMYRFLEHDAAARLPSACEILPEGHFPLWHVQDLWPGRRPYRLAGDPRRRPAVRMATLKDYTTICSSAPSEILSIIALRAKEVIIGEHLARIQKNLVLLDGFFAHFSHRFSWVRPQAGTIAFPRLNGVDSLKFCQQVIRDTNIMLLPVDRLRLRQFPFQDRFWQREHGGGAGQVGGVSAQRRGMRSGGRASPLWRLLFRRTSCPYRYTATGQPIAS